MTPPANAPGLCCGEIIEARTEIGNLKTGLAEEKAARSKTDDRLDALKNWIIAATASALVGVLLQIAAMAMKGSGGK